MLLDVCVCVAGAGADFVMLGGMLAGHDQSGGDIVERDGQKYKLFYGMSSSTAMKKYQSVVKDYRCVCVCGGVPPWSRHELMTTSRL